MRALQPTVFRADDAHVDLSLSPALTLDDPWAVDVDAEARSHETHTLVRLGDARYAIALEAIAEVLPVPGVTRLPASPLWLAGVANWRGRVLAVLDLRPLLGADQRPASSSARLVVLREGEVEAGLIVDAVVGLMTADGDPHDLPATVAPAAASILSGTVDQEGPVALLDVTSALALRGQLAQARPSR
jgi:chemotaxis signal transduction protein